MCVCTCVGEVILWVWKIFKTKSYTDPLWEDCFWLFSGKLHIRDHLTISYWPAFFPPDHSGCMNLGFKAMGQPGYGYKFSEEIFPFSFSSQVHHWKFSLDSPKGQKLISVGPTHSELALWGLSFMWSGLLLVQSPSHANLTFPLSPVSSEAMKSQSSWSLWQTFSR